MTVQNTAATIQLVEGVKALPGEAEVTSLVTGGAGFLGSHVADALIEMGHKVVVLDDMSGGFMDNVNPKAEFLIGSVSDKRCVDNVFGSYKIDYVYHLAAYAAESLSHFIRAFNYTNNVVGSMNLISAAIKNRIKCFVFTSSIAVYGSQKPPMREEMTPQPEDPYGIAKYAVELDLKAANRMFGLDYIIFRPGNVYGPRQNTGDPYRNVVAIFMERVLCGEPCPIFGDGTQTRAFTHVDDVAPVIAKSMMNPRAYNETFNIGSDKPHTVSELARLVHKTLGKKTGVVHLPGRKEATHAVGDQSKARRILGTEGTLELEFGLGDMAAWVKKVGIRPPKPFKGIELEEGLPELWRSKKTSGAVSP